MKTIWKSGITGLLLLLGCLAQAGVLQVSLNVSPPYSPYVSDYFSIQGKTIVTIVNPQVDAFQVKLVGRIEGDNGVVLSTSPSYVPPSPINVPAFGSVTLYGNQLERYFDINTVSLQGISKQQLIAGGGLPEGNYTICVQAFDFTSGQPLSDEAPSGCSPYFTIQQIEPPFIISPVCEENVRAFEPQNVVFSWTAPSKISSNMRYLLKIAELPLNYPRNPGDALQNLAAPPFFEKEVSVNTYVYTMADPRLTPGRRYVFSVTAFEKREGRTGYEVLNNTSFRNNGQSEPCVFTYGETPPKEETATVPSATKPPKPGQVKYTPSAVYEPIPTTTIQGRLVYAFRKTEMPASMPLTGEIVDAGKPVNFQDGASKGLYNDPNFFSGAQASSQTNSGIWSSMNESGSSTSAGSGSYNPMIGGSGNYSVTVEGMESAASQYFGSLKDAETKGWEAASAAIAAEAGADRFPLSNSYVEVRLYLKDAIISELMKSKSKNPFLNMPKNGILLGTAKTDKEGNFSISYNKGDIEFAFYYAELLVVNGTQFDYPAIPMPVELGNFGAYDLGEVLGLARTFRLNVKVIGANGKKLESANVKVLRNGGFYTGREYLDPEGNRFYGGNTTSTESTKEKKDEKPGPHGSAQVPVYQGLEAVSQLGKMELVSENNVSRKFYRLFESGDGGEYYTLQISAEDHKPLNTPLYFLPYGDLTFSGSSTHASTSNGILTVSATYILIPEKPKVMGRVVDKTTEVPMPGVTVTLHTEDNGKVYTTKTGTDGKFLIKNIAAGIDPYLLTLSGAGIAEWTDPSKVFLETDGITVNRDPLYVSAQLIPVMGVVSDLGSIPLNNAELKWKNGGKSFYTASNGHYIGYNTAGKHTLVVSKPGYRTKEIQVELTAPNKVVEASKSKIPKNATPTIPGTGNMSFENIASKYGNNWIGSVNGVDYTQSASAKIPKNIGTGASNSGYQVIVGESKIDMALVEILEAGDNNIGDPVTLDTIKLSQFFVRVLVTDKDTKLPLANAVVTVNDGDKEYLTNTEGVAVLSNVPEGSSTIFIAAPAGSNYVAASASVAVQPSQDTTQVEVGLGGGAKLSGKVLSGGSPVADAEIFVEGKAYIKTKSDASGNFGFGVPVGEYTIVASKSGFVADKKTMTFEKKDYTQDFELKDPGFDATKLLGFDLILYDSKPGGAPDEFKISGAITHIPSNSLFSIPNSKKLEFFDQVVVKTGSSIAPKTGEIKLADAQLDFKLFDYLWVNLKQTGGLKVKAPGGDNTKGTIGGELLLDINKTFANKYGLTWPGGSYKLSKGDAGDFTAFYSGGELPVPASVLKLIAPVSGWEIYGVKLTPDLENTVVDKNGISFAGKIDLGDIPGLGATTLTLKALQIGTNGDIKKLEINLSPNPTINFLSWKMTLKDVSLNQYGLRFGGELNIPIPGSSPAIFKFADVNVNSSGLNGGTYSLSGQIDFFGVAGFKGLPGNPLSFGKIPGSTNYKLNGGGSLSFGGSLLNKAVDIQNFMVATNGEFGFTAAPNLNFDFGGGMANFKLSTLGIYPSQSKFSVGGSFGLNIPGIGASAGGSIHYAKTGITVDKLAIAASMGGIGGFSADVEFGSNKFAGAGKLNIAGVAGMGMAFEYKKVSGGKEIKASISTGITVPVGVVTFENLGGGFSYSSAQSKYGVNLTGRMVLAPGTSAVVALENIIVGVEASPPGPVFFGSADPYVLSMGVGKAEFKLDIPQKNFYISTTLGKSLNIIPGVGMSASGGFMLAASAKSSDPYWLMGLYTKMNMFGLFNENLNITGAWNLNRSAHPEYNDYTLFIPDAYLNGGKINGLHTKFKSVKGITPDDPYCDGVSDLANFCAYAYTDLDLSIHSNFASGTYGFDVSNTWGAGGSADFFGFNVATVNFSANVALNGSYGGGTWGISGSGSGSAQASAGLCSPGGCGNGVSWGCCVDPCPVIDCEVCPCPCGVRFCIHPSVSASYSSASGDFDVGLSW